MVDRMILGDLCEMRLGLQASVQSGGTLPLVRVGDLRGVLQWEQVGSTAEIANLSDELVLLNDDVLIARSGDGSVGNSALVVNPPKGATFASYVIRIRPNEQLDGAYLAYWFRTAEGVRQIRERVVGTPISNLSIERLASMELPLPSLEEQRRVGSEAHHAFLLVQRANASIARAQIQASSIRVDSHPIWRELRHSKHPQKTVAEIAHVRDRQRVALNTAERRARPGSTPYYGASGIIDHVAGSTHQGEHVLVSEDGNNLRSRRTPIAFVATGNFWANNHIHVLEPDSNQISARYLAFAIDSQDLEHLLTGSAQPKLNQRSLNTISVTLPDLRRQAEVVALCTKFEAEIAQAVDLCADAKEAIDGAWEAYLLNSYLSPKERQGNFDLKQARIEVETWLEKVRDLGFVEGSNSLNEPDVVAEVAIPSGYIPIEQAFEAYRTRVESADFDDVVDDFFDSLRERLAVGDSDIRKVEGRSFVKAEQ